MEPRGSACRYNLATLKTFLLFSIFLACIALAAARQHPSFPTEEELIKATILDYVDGYYTADAARVRRALSPALAKRAVGKTKDGKIKIFEETAEAFIALTKSGDGPKSYAKDKRKMDVTVYDVTKNIASAKLVGSDWMDYIHLSKQNGHWLIMNVLWTSLPAQKP